MNIIYDKIYNYIFGYPERFNYYAIIAVKIVILLVGAKILIILINRFINRIIKLSPKFKFDGRKSITLTGVLKSFTKQLIYIITGITILNIMDFPTQSFVAAAGLGGIAIGFGAQSLVKDLVSGFFILFEDQYSVGDYITIQGMTGVVEDIELRITKLRAFTGELYIIPNGEIKTVTNQSRGNALAVIDMPIAFENEIENALSIMDRVANEYYEKHMDIVAEKPQVLGVVKVNETNVMLRLIISTYPLKHWLVERNLRVLIKKAFDSENIKMPYNKIVLVNNKDSQCEGS